VTHRPYTAGFGSCISDVAVKFVAFLVRVSLAILVHAPVVVGGETVERMSGPLTILLNCDGPAYDGLKVANELKRFWQASAPAAVALTE